MQSALSANLQCCATQEFLDGMVTSVRCPERRLPPLPEVFLVGSEQDAITQAKGVSLPRSRSFSGFVPYSLQHLCTTKPMVKQFVGSLRGTVMDDFESSCTWESETSTEASCGNESPGSLTDESQQATTPEVWVAATLQQLIPLPPGVPPPPPPPAHAPPPVLPSEALVLPPPAYTALRSTAINASVQQLIPLPPNIAPPPAPSQSPMSTASEPITDNLDRYWTILEGIVAEIRDKVEHAEATRPFSHTCKSSCFEAAGRPRLSLLEYLERICYYAKCSEESLVVALIFLDRAVGGGANVLYSTTTCFRLLFTSLMVAYKYHDGYDDDHFTGNCVFWSRVGGFEVELVAQMECEFVKMLNWRLFVTPEEFECYEALLCK